MPACCSIPRKAKATSQAPDATASTAASAAARPEAPGAHDIGIGCQIAGPQHPLDVMAFRRFHDRSGIQKSRRRRGRSTRHRRLRPGRHPWSAPRRLGSARERRRNSRCRQSRQAGRGRLIGAPRLCTGWNSASPNPSTGTNTASTSRPMRTASGAELITLERHPQPGLLRQSHQRQHIGQVIGKARMKGPRRTVVKL